MFRQSRWRRKPIRSSIQPTGLLISPSLERLFRCRYESTPFRPRAYGDPAGTQCAVHTYLTLHVPHVRSIVIQFVPNCPRTGRPRPLNNIQFWCGCPANTHYYLHNQKIISNFACKIRATTLVVIHSTKYSLLTKYGKISLRGKANGSGH